MGIAHQNLKNLAAKFSDFHNASLSKGQQNMLDDGCPSFLLLSQEVRAARLAAHPFTPAPARIVQPKKEDPDVTKMIAKAALKKKIHIPKKTAKPKIVPKLPATHPVNRGRRPAQPKGEQRLKPAPQAPRKTVSNKEVADFICSSAGGVSMAALEKRFAIDAHPMRAKIHYAKHKLGYAIECSGGVYRGTAPKAAA